MKSILRSFGLVALGAAAFTIIAITGPRQTGSCETARNAGSGPCAFEQLVWDLVRDSGDEGELETYIRMYPDGRFVEEAKRRLWRLMPKYGVLPPRSAAS